MISVNFCWSGIVTGPIVVMIHWWCWHDVRRKWSHQAQWLHMETKVLTDHAVQRGTAYFYIIL